MNIKIELKIKDENYQAYLAKKRVIYEKIKQLVKEELENSK